MTLKNIATGTAHKLPADLRKALIANPKSLAAWNSISPLARNEWICWIITVKQEKTRREHVVRTCSQLAEGKKRPCCWVGCIHRTDKAPGAWVQKVLLNK